MVFRDSGLRRSHDGVAEGIRGRMCREKLTAGLMVVWTDFETESQCRGDLEPVFLELGSCLVSTTGSDHAPM